MYPIILILTGSWSDRTVGVVDIRVVQVAVAIDIEHNSIAVGIHIVRRERPNNHSPQNKKSANDKTKTSITLILIYSLL